MNDHVYQYVLSCRGLTKVYQQGSVKITVLRNLDFDLLPGERVGIIGASGSGKTTLLNLLGGIDNPSSGKVEICGQDISTLAANQQDSLRNKTLGFVYQFHHLLGEFTALENVAMPLIIGRNEFSDCKARAEKILTQVGLGDRLHHKPAQLSGGERQRVAIARALANDPVCVLMDEPTGNLDPGTARSIHTLMQELKNTLETSFVVVTHDRQLAEQMDRVLVLEGGALVKEDELTDA